MSSIQGGRKRGERTRTIRGTHVVARNFSAMGPVRDRLIFLARHLLSSIVFLYRANKMQPSTRKFVADKAPSAFIYNASAIWHSQARGNARRRLLSSWPRRGSAFVFLRHVLVNTPSRNLLASARPREMLRFLEVFRRRVSCFPTNNAVEPRFSARLNYVRSTIVLAEPDLVRD